MNIDLHADTPLLMHWCGYDFCRPHKAWLPFGAWWSHVDLPRMRENHLDAQLFGLVALPMQGDPFDTVEAMIDRLDNAARSSEGKFQIVRTFAELSQCVDAQITAGMLSMEGVHPLRGKIERAQHLIDRGVVSFGLAHFHANEACRPAFGLGCDSSEGLTEFGRELVAFLGDAGTIVDLTHINRRGFFDAIEELRGPVLVSHTGVDGAHAHWRNLDDRQIRTIADHGGVMGVIFARNFLGGHDVDAVVHHIQHVVNVGGASCAALGSDFDGFIVPVRGLRDLSGHAALREALRAKGFGSSLIADVMGGNAAALLERALNRDSRGNSRPSHE